MADDVSVSIRIAIMLMMTAALLASVITVTIPATNFLTEQSDKFTDLSSYPYKALISMHGHELNGGRVYRMIEECYPKVGIVAIREHPITDPDNYEIIVCKERKSDTTGINDEVSDYVSNVGVTNDDNGYNKISSVFQHDNINNNFILIVNILSDGGLEVICDVPDEYRE